MRARNGVIESLDREERAGVGVRALIGSSWGFFAVPDVGAEAGRRAGEGALPSPGLDPRARAADAAGARSGRSRPLGEPGSRRPLVGRPRREGRPPFGGDQRDAGPRRRRGGGQPSHSGNAQMAGLIPRAPTLDQHIVECGAAMNATASARRDPAAQLPRYPRAIRHARMGARPRARSPGQCRPDRGRRREPCSRADPVRRSTPRT